MENKELLANIFGELIIGELFIVIDDIFVLVQWPEVQELMEQDWFRKECILHQAFDDQEYLSSAYFVPLKRLLVIKQPG